MWCKTIVTTLFYIARYNSIAPSPRHTLPTYIESEGVDLDLPDVHKATREVEGSFLVELVHKLPWKYFTICVYGILSGFYCIDRGKLHHVCIVFDQGHMVLIEEKLNKHLMDTTFWS